MIIFRLHESRPYYLSNWPLFLWMKVLLKIKGLGKWDCLNCMSVMIMKCVIPETFRGARFMIPQLDHSLRQEMPNSLRMSSLGGNKV